MVTHRIAILLLAGVVATTTLGCDLSIERTTAAKLDSDEGTALALRAAFDAGADSGAEGAAGTLAEPTGWATLKGSFNLVGTAPQLRALSVTKDNEVCTPGGIQLMEETVVVNAANRIKSVLIYLDTQIPSDDPKWEHESYAAERMGEVEFDQKNCVFLTHVAAMRSTQTLRILNSDGVLHNTKIEPKRGAVPFNGSVPSNSRDVTYNPNGQTSSPFPISCSIHPWMNAFLITRDNPYFAVTDENGEFEILNIPTGVELVFRVWQEKSGDIENVAVNDVPQDRWKRGRFTVTLAHEEVRDMKVTVDASVFE
jgi:hypothetical protein